MLLVCSWVITELRDQWDGPDKIYGRERRNLKPNTILKGLKKEDH